MHVIERHEGKSCWFFLCQSVTFPELEIRGEVSGLEMVGSWEKYKGKHQDLS